MRGLKPLSWLVATIAGIPLLIGCQANTASFTATEAKPLPASTQAVSAEPSPLKQLHTFFRPSYEAARERMKNDLSPLIVVRFSDIYLMKQNRIVATAKGIPAKYHLLHRTAHIPFVVFLQLNPYFDQALPQNVVTELSRYRGMIDAAVPDLVNFEFTPDEIRWQDRILRETSAFLGGLRRGQHVTRNMFIDYKNKTQAAMMALADAAGCAQVDALHSTMKAWRREMTESEWKQVRIMILGVRQPRHENAATQYFAAVFPDQSNSLFPGENKRVFYIEHPEVDRDDLTFEIQQDNVAALILDQEASEMIFNNPYRMSIDVMADGARRRISELDLSDLKQ